MMKRRLPIGIQDFITLREEHYVYVDKTAHIYELLTGSGQVFFLSRPRRFGKSLLCSTLGAIFEGRRDLFENLAIASTDWNWKARPVIRIDLNPGNYSLGLPTLRSNISNILSNHAADAGLSLRGDTISIQFGNLLSDLHRQTGERAAVIIDEYDKPLLNTIGQSDIHDAMRQELKGFYGVLKSSGEHLQFVLLTGVTKFSQVSVFSDLNNLTDISLDGRYCGLCGITQDELEEQFAPEIEKIVETRNVSKDEYLIKLKHFYNGYRFSDKKTTVYNPFGILNHFNSMGRFDTYWFATGTPTFLIRLIQKQKIDILNLEKSVISPAAFHKFDVDNMEAVPVLYQTGYLTIVDYNEDYNEFSLGFPNEEVRAAFSMSLLENSVNVPGQTVSDLLIGLSKYFMTGNLEQVKECLVSFLASIPYDIQVPQEKYYQTILYLIFRMIGLNCLSEARTANGRIDCMVETKDRVYCFEFKIDDSAENALKQINAKEYLLPWAAGGKHLVKIGVNFDTKKRNIDGWVTD